MNLKRKVVLAFLVTILLIKSVDSKAWDSTAAKYYPVSIGNTYIIKKDYQTIFCAFSTGFEYLKVKVTGDTIMPNGKKYFRFDGYNYFSHWNYQRIDSNSMNVYGYSDGNELLIDSLLGRLNNFFSGKRNLNAVFAKVDDEINNYYLFGQNRNAKIILNNSSELFYSYYLIENFGLCAMDVCTDDSGYLFTTLGCVIDGVVYGDTTLTSIQQIQNTAPEKFSLSQNYPNPFNPETNLEFGISELGFVSLKVYDVVGNEIATLVNETKPAGSYNYQFSTVNYQLSSGIFFYTLTVDGVLIDTKRMVLLK